MNPSGPSPDHGYTANVHPAALHLHHDTYTTPPPACLQIFLSAASGTTVSLAYLADRLAPEHRAAAFGLVMASFSLGVIIGPVAGSRLQVLHAA